MKEEGGGMKAGSGQSPFILYILPSMATPPPTPTDAASDLAQPVASDDHLLGSAGASITLLEYGDYECPDCVASFPNVEALLADGSDRIRFAFRHFPKTSVHPHASVAAQAAEAAGAQGKFWDMHRELFRRQGGLEPDDLDRIALRLNLEIYKFQSDLTTRRWARRIERDHNGGLRSGVKDTPTFFVNGRRVAGMTAEDLRAAITSAAGDRLGPTREQ